MELVEAWCAKAVYKCTTITIYDNSSLTFQMLRLLYQYYQYVYREIDIDVSAR